VDRADGFGVVVAATDSDLHLARATLASIRYFMGDVPVAVVFDGERSLEREVRTYDLQVIRKADVENGGLRERSFGFGVTKMVAWWEAPFERVLYLESDTFAWGDLRHLAWSAGSDVLIDLPECPVSEADVDRYYFDVAQLEARFPEFDWRAHRTSLMGPGTYCFRRGILSLDRYLELLDLGAEQRLFKGGEQGILNFMLFEASDAAQLHLEQVQYQTYANDWSRKVLNQRFPIHAGVPDVVGAPRVAHWAGNRKFDALSSPAHTFFRRRFELDAGCTRVAATARVRAGDERFRARRVMNRLNTKARIAARRIVSSVR
jgi:hypothetical protein